MKVAASDQNVILEIHRPLCGIGRREATVPGTATARFCASGSPAFPCLQQRRDPLATASIHAPEPTRLTSEFRRSLRIVTKAKVVYCWISPWMKAFPDYPQHCDSAMNEGTLGTPGRSPDRPNLRRIGSNGPTRRLGRTKCRAARYRSYSDPYEFQAALSACQFLVTGLFVTGVGDFSARLSRISLKYEVVRV